jgi:hypothetical protein
VSEFQEQGAPLTDGGFSDACDAANLGAPELWAVISVETSGCGYIPDRRPKILFERHYFSRLTNGAFDIDDPDVSQPTPGGYGAPGAHQYDRLAVAMGLDRSEALRSTLWGLGQIMGANFSAAGFQSVEDMVDAMVTSENAQLEAMVTFLKANNWDKLLRTQAWAGFSRFYNGPNYAAHNYDGLLEHFYARYSAGPIPDLRVRAVQLYLTYKQFAPGYIDGILGASTRNAIEVFQKSAGIPVTGEIDDELIAGLSSNTDSDGQ